MAQIKIYDEESNRYYNVNIELKQSILDNTTDGETDYYLIISTNITTSSGAAYPTFVVKNLTDTPPGYGTATDFTDLCGMYIEYFGFETLAYSSSSSSSELYSESSESSSSSEEYSESSESSSSSS